MANFYGSLIGFGAGGAAPTWTVATGGTITTSGNYKIHSFTGAGTFEITTLGDDAVVEYLVIAGGGAGAGRDGTGAGGGGGAGGYRTASDFGESASSEAITVGAGAPGAATGAASCSFD